MGWWPRLLFVAISGFLIGEAQTAHPWLAQVCLAPLLVALMAPVPSTRRPPTLAQSAGLGALAYATASTYGWGIGQYGWTIYGAGMSYLSFGGALFGALCAPFMAAPRRAWRVAGVIPAWVLVEWSRSATSQSYPILVGAGLGEYPFLAQAAALGGPWILGAFVAALALLLAQAFEEALLEGPHPWLDKKQGRAWPWVAAAVVLWGVFAGGGALRLHLAGEPGVRLWEGQSNGEPLPPRALVVSSLQGGVPTWTYRRAVYLKRLQEAIDADYFDLLAQATEAKPWGRAPDWVILPEASLNRTLPARPKSLDGVARLRDFEVAPTTTVLFGSTTYLGEPDPLYPDARKENLLMALVPDERGRLRFAGASAKHPLVPIVEAEYRPGPEDEPLDTPQARAGVLICYASMYPSLAAKLSEADVFVVAANDAGLRWSQAPRIHARLGILRAIEQGRPLIHSAQAGYTFLVDAYGRRTPELGLFERGLMVGAVDLTPAPAPYRALGHAWVALAGLVYAGALASLRLSQRIKSKSSP